MYLASVMYFAPTCAKFMSRHGWSDISQRSEISLDTGIFFQAGKSPIHQYPYNLSQCVFRHNVRVTPLALIKGGTCNRQDQHRDDRGQMAHISIGQANTRKPARGDENMLSCFVKLILSHATLEID